jgi:tRNA acetyltransferase TAN1
LNTADLSIYQFQYAIRPTVRGNSKLSRDVVIKTVADVVGPEHPVNLKNYDYMILVDVAQVGFSIQQWWFEYGSWIIG